MRTEGRLETRSVWRCRRWRHSGGWFIRSGLINVNEIHSTQVQIFAVLRFEADYIRPTVLVGVAQKPLDPLSSAQRDCDIADNARGAVYHILDESTVEVSPAALRYTWVQKGKQQSTRVERPCKLFVLDDAVQDPLEGFVLFAPEHIALNGKL